MTIPFPLINRDFLQSRDAIFILCWQFAVQIEHFKKIIKFSNFLNVHANVQLHSNLRRHLHKWHHPFSNTKFECVGLNLKCSTALCEVKDKQKYRLD